MRGLVHLLALLLWLPFAVQAQELSPQEEQDKGYIASFISNNLSGVSRSVVISGFSGALSSRATIRVLTVADDTGVWLRMEGLVLDWDRAALLGGRIDINELSADQITILRAPVRTATPPNPEAVAFALPELPVSVNIAQLGITRITLGAPLLGEEVNLSVSGDVALQNGEGTATLLADRIGDQAGQFALTGSYSNITRILGLTLDLTEAPDGIIARVLNLPGRPAVHLALEGTAPIDDYVAELSVATDGTERIAGTAGLVAIADPDGGPAGRGFSLDVRGDVTPLLAPGYHDFFGTDVQLVVQGQNDADGAAHLTALQITTASFSLAGTADFAADGWPERFALKGQIGTEGGEPVVLPIAGAATAVEAMTLDVQFDAAADAGWTGEFRLVNFTRPGLQIPGLILNGGGTIVQASPDVPGRFSADLTYIADGIVLADPAFARAFGEQLSGQIQFARSNDGPFEIGRLTLTGPGIEADVQGSIAGPADGFETSTSITLTAADASRFDLLTGLDLGGAADVLIVSTIRPLDGVFDLQLTGGTTNLALGIAALDPLLRGAGELQLQASRDTTGTRISDFSVTTPALTATGSADLTNGVSAADFDLTIPDISLSLPGLTGPAQLTGTARRDADGIVTADLNATLPGAVVIASLAQTPDQPIRAELFADLTDLGRFAGLAGYPLRGRATVGVTGTLQPDFETIDLTISGTTNDLGAGLPQLDPLFAGQGTIAGHLLRDGPDSLRLEGFALRTPAVTALATARLDAGVGSAGFDISLPDISIIAPALSGPAQVQGSFALQDRALVSIDIDGSGPGATARLQATRPDPATAFDTDLTMDIASLAPYSRLFGQDISGAITATVRGSLFPDLRAFDLTLAAQTRNIDPGNSTAALLLRGAGNLSGRFTRGDAGGLQVQDLLVQFPNLSASGDLDGRGGAGTARFTARLADIGLFTPEFSGPVTATGTARRDGAGNWQVDTQATGPGGTNAVIAGQIGAAGQLDLTARGTAPLGLINGMIEPRRISGVANFDLALRGRPTLDGLSGSLRLSDARLTDPVLSKAVSGIAGTVTLTNGAAQLNLSGGLDGGGRLTLAGSVGLRAPHVADLVVGLDSLVLRDPTLYETTASGQITVTGPLAGGAVIAGLIDLGPTEVQVPSSGVSALGDLPVVQHINPPGAVQQTLDRAGLTNLGGNAGPGPGRRAFALNLTIRAPGRVFIRGRGLDAELGGQVVLGGTTRQIIPSGQFDLVRGRLSILNQRFDLTEGSASLQGNFTPVIRLVARTTARTGTVISIIMDGPITEPSVTFVSAPDLPQDEVLAQLIFGRDLSAITPLQAIQLAAAVGTLAGRGGGGLIEGFRTGLGVDDFDITSDEAGNTALRIGKYLSDNVYTDVTISSGTTEINLNLDLTEDITVKGSVGSDGETGLGIFFERDY